MVQMARPAGWSLLNAADEMPFFSDWLAYTCPDKNSRTFKPKALFTQYRQRAAILEGRNSLFADFPV
jgi:hypothetical protein